MTWLSEQLWKEIDRGRLRSVDLHFAAMMTESLADVEYDRVYLTIVWLSQQLASGHICIDLLQMSQQINALFAEFCAERDQYISELLVDPAQLRASLLACRTVGQGLTVTPLVLEENRLYLYRMWSDENDIADYFCRNIDFPVECDSQLTSYLDAQFPIESALNYQKLAVALAVLQPTTIISGGPGTGKTTTVAKLLRVLIQLNSKGLRIVLAAPTGKAASRLTQSLQKAQQVLALTALEQRSFPQETLTLHRLLGASDTQQRFRYHQNNPLHLDVLVVDEASMIDLPLLAALLKALPPSAKLILLGDHDQLASVEAGSVLGDLCYFSRYPYSQACTQLLERILKQPLPVAGGELRTLSDSICVLRQSYRFAQDSGIAQLARAVNQGDQIKVLNCFKAQLSGIQCHSLATDSEYIELLQTCAAGYSYYLKAVRDQEITTLLQQLSLFQVITPLRDGPFGVIGLNENIERILAEQGVIQLNKHTAWYEGRPIMILRNNRQLGLYNGDIGVARRAANGQMRVYFKLSQGEIKGFSPHRLPEHETAFALTIHKSQGSEFGHVVCVLPKEYHPLLTKELLYTAITRAQHQFTLFSATSVLLQTVQRRITRDSGLINKLTKISQNHRP